MELDFPLVANLSPKFTATYETQSALTVHARPVTHSFAEPTPILPLTGRRLAFSVERPALLWLLGTELSGRAEVRVTLPHEIPGSFEDRARLRAYRGVLFADMERPIGSTRFISQTLAVGAPNPHGAILVQITQASATSPVGPFVGPHLPNVLPQENAYFGGPVTAPGYDYHALSSNVGFFEHVEWHVPAPFMPFSLGRFGRVPAQGTFAPYMHVVGVGDRNTCPTSAFDVPGIDCPLPRGGFFPSVGAAYLLPFNLLRFDVARGLGRGGRWTFNVDVSREFWSIL